MASSETDCRSEEGITVGIIDSFITLSRLVKGRSLDSEPIREALKDLLGDSDFNGFLKDATDQILK